jgi:enamine deaminase RidA (YjgF/YER057c/UK114 family)
MTAIKRIDLPELVPPTGYSHVVVNRGTAYISGVAATAKDGTIVGVDEPVVQVEQTLRNLRTALSAVGAGPENLLQWTVYLTGPEHIAAWQQVRGDFVGDNRPAGTLLIVSGLAHPDLIIEVDAVAAVDD